MTRMHNPPHPGETLREDVLPALGLTVTDAAAQLGVTRAALSRVLNGHAAISPEMALRLEGWLGVESGGSADAWIAQQAAYDLWKARAAGAASARSGGNLNAMKTAFESIKRGLQEAIEHVERYESVPFDPRAFAEEAGRRDDRSSCDGVESNSNR